MVGFHVYENSTETSLSSSGSISLHLIIEAVNDTLCKDTVYARRFIEQISAFSHGLIYNMQIRFKNQDAMFRFISDNGD